jgi:hypothetical protein
MPVAPTPGSTPEPAVDSERVRISADVVFHRDVLRPAATVAEDRNTAKTSSARPQLSLDLDDL